MFDIKLLVNSAQAAADERTLPIVHATRHSFQEIGINDGPMTLIERIFLRIVIGSKVLL